MKNHAERYGARVHQRGTCNAKVCGHAHGPGGVGIRSRITCHGSSLRPPNDRKLSDGGGLAQYPCGAPLAARSLWIDRLGVIDRPNYPTVPSENQRLLAFLFAFGSFSSVLALRVLRPPSVLLHSWPLAADGAVDRFRAFRRRATSPA